jgi:hypothetical protein
MTPTKRFMSLAECVAFMHSNEITSPAMWFEFRVSAELTPTQQVYVNQRIPYDPTIYYGLRWVDLLPALEDYKPRNRLAGVQYLSLPKAIATLRALNYSSHYHKDYQSWLLAQPLELRQQLPRDPARHYGKAFYAPDYFQKLYSFEQARRVLRREHISSSRRYKHAVKGHPERAAGFQVSAQFMEIDRFHLPIDFTHYVPAEDVSALYKDFFGKCRTIRRAKAA